MGGPCREGNETPPTGLKKTVKKTPPYTFLSFDFKRKLLVAKATFDIDASEARLPPVLKPLDVELPLSDITAQGLHILVLGEKDGVSDVHVTVSFRRPPRYFVKFEAEMSALANGKVYRRRATEMDFTISDWVCSSR